MQLREFKGSPANVFDTTAHPQSLMSKSCFGGDLHNIRQVILLIGLIGVYACLSKENIF